MNRSTFPKTLMAAACAAVILSACGGGGSSGTATTPAAASPPPAVSGQASVAGTVTGFGSVFVDGKRIDNRSVAAGRELEDGSIRPVELKLGQHVEIEHDGNLVASRVRVESEVEGAVTAVNAAAGTLVVVNQIVTVNADATLGPVTVFDAPYTKLADIKVADNVEVHALLRTDAAGKVTLQATRIEPRLAENFDRVHGLVADLAPTARTFKLGNLVIDYSDAKLQPAGLVLTNGTEVRVALAAGTVKDGAAVKALVVKARDRKGESQAKEAELGGVVSAFDAAAKTMTINGVKVDFSSASFNQSGRGLADLKAGVYVVVKGTYNTSSTLKAATIVIRGVDQDRGNEVELHGTIANFKSAADFTVRGVPVNATGAIIDLSCGANAKLANDLQVSVKGSLSASGQVTITAVKCEKPEEGVTTIEREGVAGTINLAAKQFKLTTTSEIATVQYGSATTFVDVTAETLDGKRVRVEGTLKAGILQAEKVKLRK